MRDFKEGIVLKQKIIIGIVVFAAVTLVSGATLMALSSPGTAEDPFITLSYLNDIFRPKVMTEVGKVEADMNKRFNDRIAQIETGGTGGVTQGIPEDADVFSVVTLSNGQSLTCSVGTEIMLRIGTANGFGTAPALVNSTAGSTLAAGSALVTNNMYLITIEGNGITATANLVRVLVRGSYTIT